MAPSFAGCGRSRPRPLSPDLCKRGELRGEPVPFPAIRDSSARLDSRSRLPLRDASVPKCAPNPQVAWRVASDVSVGHFHRVAYALRICDAEIVHTKSLTIGFEPRAHEVHSDQMKTSASTASSQRVDGRALRASCSADRVTTAY